jgi:hypothetical protein
MTRSEVVNTALRSYLGAVAAKFGDFSAAGKPQLVLSNSRAVRGRLRGIVA